MASRVIFLLSLLLALTGCPACDSACSCLKSTTPPPPQSKLQQALDAVSAVASNNGSAASQAALYVINDSSATQERKTQALQLLFELERGRQLTDSVQRLDALAAQLEVLLERKVEREDGR